MWPAFHFYGTALLPSLFDSSHSNPSVTQLAPLQHSYPRHLPSSGHHHSPSHHCSHLDECKTLLTGLESQFLYSCHLIISNLAHHVSFCSKSFTGFLLTVETLPWQQAPQDLLPPTSSTVTVSESSHQGPRHIGILWAPPKNPH